VKKTGEVLRKAREEKGLSLHEVGIFLKINTRILQAIENGDLSKLPAKTFLRGFVQSYAKYLKLNSEEVLALFQSELKPQHEESPIETPVVEIVSESENTENTAPTESVENHELVDTIVPNRSSTNQSVLMGPGLTTDTLKLKTIVISTLALILVFVVYFGNNLIRRYQKEAEIPDEISVISSDIESDSTEEPIQQQETPSPLTPTPTAEPLEVVAPKTTAPVAAAQTVVPPVVPTTPPQIVPTSIATQQKTANETTSLPTQPQPTNTASETKPAEGKSLEVIVEAKDNVEIEYASAKSNPQKLLLKGDQIHTFKSKSGIRLKISNGGAVNVIVNGQDLGAPGALGQSVQLSYE